jgi:hypothetical protein
MKRRCFNKNQSSHPHQEVTKEHQQKCQLFRIVRVDEFPAIFEPFNVYLPCDNGHTWIAGLLCPCGCKQKIYLNLLPDIRPCWKIKEPLDGTVTIQPSILQVKGCRSHFFIRKGNVEWVIKKEKCFRP